MSLNVSIGVTYKEVKEFFKDVRNFFKGRKTTSDDPDKCDRCRQFKFCKTGFDFLVSVGGLDEKKIGIEKEEDGIMTLDLRRVSKDAKGFLSDKGFRDFHDTLHDYAESMNYVGVLNHILFPMSLFDLWLNEVRSLSPNCKTSATAFLRQLKAFLPVIYETKKDPYGGKFRKTSLARQVFTSEVETMIEKSINLLKVDSTSKFKKEIDKTIKSIAYLRIELLEEEKIALKAGLITGEKLRGYYAREQ